MLPSFATQSQGKRATFIRLKYFSFDRELTGGELSPAATGFA
jgi:hypothetical protein